ncbi:PASTA domain protein [Staphylococcus epidermidis VCU123]|nr:PASTA domain protein [Staphylococcus epidermidis VCU123]
MKIAILSIIFVILLIGLFSFVAMAVFGNKYEEMPDLKGKTEKQAEKVLDSHHLKVGDISRNYSDKYPENQIIKTNPDSGERVEQGNRVDIVLSKGPEKVKMPNVLGMSKNDALKKLKAIGFKDIHVEQAYSQTYEKGLISEQSVVANSEVAVNNHHITIYESLGVRQVYVNNYENKSYESAKKELEDKGFKVQVTKENNDDVEKGNVISQSPKDKTVDEGSTILLVVSKGEKSEEEDDEEDKDTTTKNETVKVPYTGKKSKSQKVEVFIRDIENKGDSAVQTFNIKSDKTINIPLKIKKGSDAGYTIRVDNKIVADKDVSYDG